ncbi:hypothetical protein VNO78_32609 [Psophocarpus tetragonolobus]|uniref:Uncharacterized protein n=1 Tax=Psophocarpus tetragonolobus TaxID=3891 RepID=A0AAN9NZS1_PSOTE
MDHGKLVSENEWSYGEILFVIPPYSGSSGSIRWTGIYVNKTLTTMEDVRFSKPYPPKTTHVGNSGTKNHVDIQRAPLIPHAASGDWNRPVMSPNWSRARDNILTNSGPMEKHRPQTICDSDFDRSLEALTDRFIEQTQDEDTTIQPDIK